MRFLALCILPAVASLRVGLSPRVGPRASSPVALDTAPPVGFEWGISLLDSSAAVMPEEPEVKAVNVESWYDAGVRLQPSEVEPKPEEKAAPASKPEEKKPPVDVVSWYDSGIRLEPPAPEPVPVNVVSWYDSGIRLETSAPEPVSKPSVAAEEWPAIGGQAGYHRMAGRVKPTSA